MSIKTRRLILREIEARDNEFLRAMMNDPETEYMLGGKSLPVSIADQEKWFLNQKNQSGILRYIIESGGGTLGTVILSDIDYINGTAEVHIKIGVEREKGKGYGTEAVSALVDYAFAELRLNCLTAKVNSYNERSNRLFLRCGFVREGVLRERFFKRGKAVDVYSYSILRREWDGQIRAVKDDAGDRQ